MQILIRAVITGFGLSVGAALYKQVARRLGLEEPEDKGKEREQVPQPHAAEPVTES